MIKTLSKYSLVSMLISFLSILSVSAASVDHFEVTLEPTSIQVGEALDMTISAVAKSGEVVTDYKGSILIFSETDKDAEFPNELKENTYDFTEANQGSVKFENAVKFKKVGKQAVHIYDLMDDSIMGVAEATITEAGSTGNGTISILSPENGTTIGNTEVTVSGTTEKNHRVLISVNNGVEISTTSNSEGIYEKEVTLEDGENTISAFVLDADNNKIGDASPIFVKVSSGIPTLSSIKITPTGEVSPGTQISVEAIASPNLTTVEVVMNDIVTKLKETSSGKYTAALIAPDEVGIYPIDVTLKDEIGHEQKQRGAISVVVKSAPEDPAPTEEDPLPIAAEIRDPMKITGIKLTVLKTKSILTWDKNEKAESYNIYKKNEDDSLSLIQNVTEPHFEVNIVGDVVTYDYFAIKGVAKTSTGVVYEGDLSEATKIQTGPEIYIILMIISLLSAGYLFTRRKAV